MGFRPNPQEREKNLKNIINNNFEISNCCLICGDKGQEYFKKNFSENEFKKFFTEFYGDTKYLILIDFLINKEFIVLKCNNCNFIWQKFRPINEFANILYDKIIDSNKSFKKSEQIFKNRKEKFKIEFKFIFNYLDLKKINVLDFGAGWGSWLKSINDRDVNSYALEISKIRKKYLNDNKINVLDLNEISNYANYFDFIRLEQVLEHLTDLDSSLELLKKISTKHSIIYVSVPNGIKQISKNTNIKIEKGPIQPLEHINCFSNKSLKKLFSNYGFRPLNKMELSKIYLNKSLRNNFNLKMYIKNLYENSFTTSIKFKLK